MKKSFTPRRFFEKKIKDTTSLQKLIFALTVIYGIKRTKIILNDLQKNKNISLNSLRDMIGLLKDMEK